MKICEKCGKQLNDDAVFCEGCGTKLPDKAEEITVSEDIQAYEFKTKLMTMPKDKFLKTMAIITLTAIAVFVGAFFAINAILYSNYELDIIYLDMDTYCTYIGKERTHTFCKKVWGGVVNGVRADDNDIIREVVIPDSITSIYFPYCTSLTSIEIPNSVTSIAHSAFYGCTSLTNVEIPDSVTSIGGDAFYGCTSLTSINIPDSVEIIRNGAFIDCPLLDVDIPYGCEVEEYAFEREQRKGWFW